MIFLLTEIGCEGVIELSQIFSIYGKEANGGMKFGSDVVEKKGNLDFQIL
jgi:hypothetical protein